MANIALDAGKVVLKDGKVSCSCCNPCGCGQIPPLQSYCYTVPSGGSLDPDVVLSFYLSGVESGFPFMVWAVAPTFDAPYLSFWPDGFPYGIFANPPNNNKTYGPTFFYSGGAGEFWIEGTDSEICLNLQAHRICLAQC